MCDHNDERRTRILFPRLAGEVHAGAGSTVNPVGQGQRLRTGGGVDGETKMEEITTNTRRVHFYWWEFKKDLEPCTLVSWCPVTSPCTICAEHQNERPYIIRAWGRFKKIW